MPRIGRLSPRAEFFGPLCLVLSVDDIPDDTAARLFAFVLELDAADSPCIVPKQENTSACSMATGPR
jgi:hypothetical protein